MSDNPLPRSERRYGPGYFETSDGTESSVPRTELRYDPSYFRSVGELWLKRLAVLLAGIALGAVALGLLYRARVVPDELGVEGWAHIETFGGQRLNAWHLEEYGEVYAAAPVDEGGREGLWLGNSQLHAVNQRSEGDHTAPHYASARLGWPMYALSLANANLQEHLVVLEWALLRRGPQVLVLPVVYDDLREDGLRQEFRAISSPELVARLESSEPGKLLAAELQSLSAEQTDFQGPTRVGSELDESQKTALGFVRATFLGDISLQEVSEDGLMRRLSGVWDLWAKRPDMYATVLIHSMSLRNWVFGITATSKRPMIASRYGRNMEALSEILRTASGAGVRTLVYAVPLRQDIEPPYFVDQYRDWKKQVAEVVALAGAQVRFVDLDRLVPDQLWGTDSANAVDFMHFRGAGHRILGDEIAELVTQMLDEDAGAVGPTS